MVEIDRVALQWRVEIADRSMLSEIEAISAEMLSFKEVVSHASLEKFGPGEFALRVARDQIRIHRPSGWSPIEKSIGKVREVSLQWASDAERAAFARDLLIARQSELFSPAGV